VGRDNDPSYADVRSTVIHAGYGIVTAVALIRKRVASNKVVKS
jgi:hypothetical protein